MNDAMSMKEVQTQKNFADNPASRFYVKQPRFQDLVEGTSIHISVKLEINLRDVLVYNIVLFFKQKVIPEFNHKRVRNRFNQINLCLQVMKSVKLKILELQTKRLDQLDQDRFLLSLQFCLHSYFFLCRQSPERLFR